MPITRADLPGIVSAFRVADTAQDRVAAKELTAPAVLQCIADTGFANADGSPLSEWLTLMAIEEYLKKCLYPSGRRMGRIDPELEGTDLDLEQQAVIEDIAVRVERREAINGDRQFRIALKQAIASLSGGPAPTPTTESEIDEWSPPLTPRQWEGVGGLSPSATLTRLRNYEKRGDARRGPRFSGAKRWLLWEVRQEKLDSVLRKRIGDALKDADKEASTASKASRRSTKKPSALKR